MGGIKRTIAKEKQEMGEKNYKGKEKISFEVYQVVYKILLTSGTTNSIFWYWSGI